MNEQWAAEVKGSDGNFEVSVCYGKPSLSWGWYGPRKIRVEAGGGIAVEKRRAELIAAALNAAGYDPKLQV